MQPRNRIKRHQTVRAGDLVPHELNPRTHTDAQRHALAALYDEIGFARSVLAYELPDGRLKLIDGHLRASMDPDAQVEVEVLDVDDDEARALLLAIDPLAQLAGYDAETLAALRDVTSSPAVSSLWEAVEASSRATQEALGAAKDTRGKDKRREVEANREDQFLVLIECENEQQQVELLRRFKREGLRCQAKIS